VNFRIRLPGIAGLMAWVSVMKLAPLQTMGLQPPIWQDARRMAPGLCLTLDLFMRRT
jgi:hypothetical protein